MYILGHNNFTENGKVTTNHIFRYVGHGIDAQSIYEEYVTKFSIAKGIICMEKPTGKLYEVDYKADNKNGTITPLKLYKSNFYR